MPEDSELEKQARIAVRQVACLSADFSCFARSNMEQSIGRMSRPEFMERLAHLGGITERPISMKDADAKDWRFERFGMELMIDNLYHVRKIICGLRHLVTGYVNIDILNRLERTLIMILAATAGSSDDPILWVFVLDGYLTNFWRSLHRDLAAFGEVSNRIVWQMQELVLFMHGCMVAGVVQRFKSRPTYNSAPKLRAELRHSWYIKLFEFDPRCANDECQRLLPNPETMKKLLLYRDAFSVGTREARVGRKDARAWISSNRLSGYPCLINMILIYLPDDYDVLVLLFFWYSHIFHATSCKASRGKWTLNCF